MTRLIVNRLTSFLARTAGVRFGLVVIAAALVTLLFGGIASLSGRPDLSDAAFSSLVYVMSFALVVLAIRRMPMACERDAWKEGGDRSLVLAALVGVAAVAVGAIGLRDFLADPGVPVLRHDWQWPLNRTALQGLYKAVAAPWNPESLGSPQAYPTLYPLYAAASALAWVFGSKTTLDIIVLGILFLSGSGVYWLCYRGWRVGALPALFATVFYVYSPFVVNKFVAGHLPNLLGYALLPWLVAQFWLYDRMGRLIPYVFLAALIMGLSAAQIQYLIIDSVALLLCAAHSSRPRSALGFVGLALFLALPSQILSLYHLLIVGPAHYRLVPATIEWLRELSITPSHALALGGYIAGYANQSYPDLVNVKVRLVSAIILYAVMIVVLVSTASRDELFSLACITVGLIVTTGVLDPFGRAKTYLATHVIAANVMREYYNCESLIMLGLAVGIGLTIKRLRFMRRPLIFFAFVAALLVFPTAFLSGHFVALLNQWREPASYRQFAASIAHTSDGSRVALFPLIGPLKMKGYNFGGSEPYFTGIGDHPTLFDFNPRPEIAAVEEMYRTDRAAQGSALLGILGVRWVLLRGQVVSALPEYFYHDFHNDFWPTAWLDNRYYRTIASSRALKFVRRTPDFVQLRNLDYTPIVSLGGREFYCASTRFIEVFTTHRCPYVTANGWGTVPPPNAVTTVEPAPSNDFQDARLGWVSASQYFFLGPAFAAARGRGIVTTQPHEYTAHLNVPGDQSIYIHCVSLGGLRILLEGLVVKLHACQDRDLQRLLWVQIPWRHRAGSVTLIIENLGGPSLVETMAFAPQNFDPELIEPALYCLPKSQTFQETHISFVRKTATRLEGTYFSRRPVWLLFSETYDPRWIAYVAGIAYHPVRMNNFENAYLVPPGHHNFVIQFVSGKLERALSATQVAFWPIMLVACIVPLALRARRR